jgi:hypothetical protein
MEEMEMPHCKSTGWPDWKGEKAAAAAAVSDEDDDDIIIIIAQSSRVWRGRISRRKKRRIRTKQGRVVAIIAGWFLLSREKSEREVKRVWDHQSRAADKPVAGD